jgi:hypothetical protein
VAGESSVAFGLVSKLCPIREGICHEQRRSWNLSEASYRY